MLKLEKHGIVETEQKLLIGKSIERVHQDASNEFKCPDAN